MAAPSLSDATRPLGVFVVENHPDTLRSLRMYLEEMGHSVFSAGTVDEALAAIPAASCDVLISDIGLPDGNGWELLHALKSNGHAPPYAIAMSGFGMNADHVRSREAGFQHHLLKPFVPADLDAMLEEAAAELHAAT